MIKQLDNEQSPLLSPKKNENFLVKTCENYFCLRNYYQFPPSGLLWRKKMYKRRRDKLFLFPLSISLLSILIDRFLLNFIIRNFYFSRRYERKKRKIEIVSECLIELEVAPSLWVIILMTCRILCARENIFIAIFWGWKWKKKSFEDENFIL